MMNAEQYRGGKFERIAANGNGGSFRRFAHWLAGFAAAAALTGSAHAHGVSLVLSNDPSLKAPSFMTTDGRNLFVSGVGTDNNQRIFLVPLKGGPATTVFNASNPYQVTLVGTNLFWIDPNSGPITDTQILKAAANGSGSVTAIYTGANVGQPIVDGSGMASDGILLYAADEVAGTVWRMRLDGSALTQVGPARYSGGFGPEHLNTVAVSQGVIYLADHGSSGSEISPAVVSIATNGAVFTTLAYGAPLVSPSGIAVGKGSIYISDPGAGNTIWQLPIDGGAPSVLVSGGAFKQIQGLCYLRGDLFVADNAAGAIYKIKLPAAKAHPTISKGPKNATAGPGGTATFSVTADGGSLSYQWQLNGTDIPDATSSSLTLSNLNAAAAGAYTVVVSNAAGNTASTAAELSLLSLNMYAGLTIVGQVGATYEIDYMTSLPGNTNWTVLTNIVLPGSPYIFFDTTSPFSSSRFYRASKQ